ncbi:haloacid dehalogenase type II [Ferrimonas lipolytica]|uniref:(S)-2-haloacid dehalogenase n=1 Tax=Ferrimonas lipolytica TaxID=2724191 RepID=A0A6H1U9U8_9GAMM|nr:haloacid dehalogenase type II [Ferrimonas lipolytica]QIZ75804.1 haloacid dehalogenase type II [Ferrimonas lipolytica]
MTTLAFDVYGTLINPHGVVKELQLMVGYNAETLSELWRSKQLEYSFRRAAMGLYAPFSSCTRDALNYSCDSLAIALSAAQKKHLLDAYQSLPAFTDVEPALAELKAANHRLFAFSNGEPESLQKLLQSANIDHYFEGTVSADEVQTFKPSPVIYRHFLQRADTTAAQTWLVSSNPFDVVGAKASGWQSAWLRRSKQMVFDPWPQQPTAIIDSLQGLMPLVR